MNTFSAFRFAARTLLHPVRPSAHFPCLNPIALHPGVHARFKKTQARRSRLRVRNREIPYEEVTLVDDDGVLTKLQLKNLLGTINHATEWVELVSETHGPVVKIVNKKFALKMEKKLREKQREGMRKNIKKEVQLTWVSEQSDLDHKLARVREYLEIGAKVDIVFSTKPKTDPPSVQAMQEKVKNTVESMAEISKEWKPVEWRKSLAAIFLQGIVDPKRKLTQQQMQLVEEEEGAENEEGAPRTRSRIRGS
ncbi:hypothetical protein DFH06DRAFT_1085112 [Mycena polygramma]|nr:hypothetical protein DFH06DRAFT_1085112 [Mycena polygramma]